MTLAPARRPVSAPPPPAVIVSLAEFRLAQSRRALAAPQVAPSAQPFPWAYVFTGPPA